MSDDAYDVLFASRLAVTEPNTALSLHSAAHRGLGRTVAGKAHAKQWSSEAPKESSLALPLGQEMGAGSLAHRIPCQGSSSGKAQNRQT